ncbi:MAG: PAS domain S-box protein [Rubrivivax sp.]|nr:PAS domain S-box protein [Rubrivivax sp.]
MTAEAPLAPPKPAAGWLLALPLLPLPATLQGPDFRIVEANPAFASMFELPTDAMVGRDPVSFEPPESQDGSRAEREGWARNGAPAHSVRRLVDGSGVDRWFNAAVTRLSADDGTALWLTLWTETSAEVEARAQARRAQDEMAVWFELAGVGFVVYDFNGLVLRCNLAFEALVETVPDLMSHASPELQQLLGWDGSAPLAMLAPGGSPIELNGRVPLPGGSRRRLGARLLGQLDETGRRRVLAVVQDRSAEEDRDIAQLEMGMLMDTASVRVATYDSAFGWLVPGRRSTPVAPPGTDVTASSGELLGIRRELVTPESMPEFERLQRALRTGERTEVRYAVRLPDGGTRWLLTRVEPRAMDGGRTTRSIVTLDVTEAERAQRRNEQLLRELTTILDSSTAGIAYLRGPVLVRCNRRFERMLGFVAGSAAGATLQEIFSRSMGALQGAEEALAALAAGQPFEAELPLERGDGSASTEGPLWYSLSLRGAQTDDGKGEAVAVLTDITRLKLQQGELEKLVRDRELMFNLSEVGIVYQRGTRIERANQAMASLTGWASTELTTLDVVELYEDARACVDFEGRVAQALREHGRFSGERRLRRRDGSRLWVQVAVRPVSADDPEAGVISSFVDIDERRRSREVLAGQADRTRAILNSVLVGIVTVSDDGIQWMNRSARRMFAGELADFVGEPIGIVATPEPDHPLRRSDLLKRVEAGETETFECRLKGRDGREFWVVGNAVLTGRADGAGQGREMTIALLDIERRRQAEVRIAQAQASLQRVIETAPLAIALFDARTLRVQQLNQTAASFFARPLPEMLGAQPEDCAAPAKAAALRGWLEDAAGGAAARQHEWHEPAPDGSAVPARVWDCRIATLDDDAAGAAQLLLVATDVTEQRAAERARLQAAIDQREVLVREVHHRIKNNLQGVAGLLQQNASRRPELADMLSEAVGQVQAIAQVYGLQVGASGPLAVAGLLRAIAQSVQRTFGRTIVVDGEVPHLLPEVEAIPVALTVNELLTNAIKHGQGAEVHCSVAVAGEGVCIRVASRARLKPGFDFARMPPGISGLGLVRALLPRRSSAMTLAQEGDEVVATLELRPPGVRVPDPQAEASGTVG